MPRRPGAFAAPAALLAAVVAAPASALVVRDGSMPRPALGFVGSWAGSSAVLIGPDWALTAAHVGGAAGQPFTLHGRAYTASRVVTHPAADLALVRIDARLPAWHRVFIDAQPGERILLAGMGRTNGSPVPNGWDWNGPARESWGENRIAGFYNALIGARFDLTGPDALPREAGLALHDSGGGMFLPGFNGTNLLIAVNVGVGGSFNQTVHGSMSYGLNLAPFVQWIESTVGFGVLGQRTEFFAPAPGGAVLAMLGLGWFGRRSRR